MQAAEAEQMAQTIAQARATPVGQKRDYSGEMPKAYDPKFVEAAVYVAPLHCMLKSRASWECVWTC